MKLPIRLALALALALHAFAPLRAADTVEIKQRWVAGKKYYQSMLTEQASQFSFGTQKMDQSSNMTVEVTMTVPPLVAGQPKRMTIRYERMGMLMTINGQKMGFDSADPSTNNDALGLSKTLGATVGKELKIVLNDKDEVADIENFDEFIKSFAPTAVPGFDPTKMFSREALANMMQQGSLHVTPGKPIAVGDSWPFETKVDLPQLGKVGVAGKYTLKGIGDHDGFKCAEITTDGTVSMELSGAADAAEGDGKKPSLATLGLKVSDGTMKGSIWFDPKLGMARDTQFVQEMTISMKNPADESATITMPMKQTVSVKLTKVEDVK